MKNFLLSSLFLLSSFLMAQSFTPGQVFAKGAKIYSPTKAYYLTLQKDGNLSMIKTSSKQISWSSKTKDHGEIAEFQKDGNLVIYSNDGSAIFTSNTKDRGALLKIQDDGNLVVYNNSSYPIWSSEQYKNSNVTTLSPAAPVAVKNMSMLNAGLDMKAGTKMYSDNGKFYVTFQTDGNLVVYNSNNSALWNSKTSNRGTECMFQEDGNLVVYDRKGDAIFSSNTNGKRAKSLKMQDDGNLVIYSSNNKAVWASDNQK